MRMLANVLALMATILVVCGCNATRTKKPEEAEMSPEMQAQLLAVFRSLEEAANQADPSLAEAVLWLEDERFSEIEDFVPEPMGADGVRSIHDWVRQHGTPGDNVTFVQEQVHLLSPDVAYATAIQKLTFDAPSRSRVTLVLFKKGDEWRIIHAHYSEMSKGE